MQKKRTGLMLLLIAVLVLSGSQAAAAAGPNDNQWDSVQIYPKDIMGTRYFEAVQALVDRGAITGDTDGMFYPLKNISRAEFATVLVRAQPQKSYTFRGSNYFGDLDGYGWATSHINRCYEEGWMKGTADRQFSPDRPVSYVEVITTLVRLQNDQELVGAWPDNYIQYAQTYNLMGSIQVVNWKAPAPKGDVAILIHRIMGLDSGPTGNEQAYIGNVTITGTVGQPIEEQQVYLTLFNEKFQSFIPAGLDVTHWFTGLSGNGLTATTSTFVQPGATELVVIISGTPKSASEMIMNATIPADMIESNVMLTATQNPRATISITE